MTNTVDEYLLMNTLGAEWIRNDFSWSKLEPEQGLWDFSFYDRFMDNAEQYNKKVLILLVYDTPWIHTDEEKGRYLSEEKLPLFLNYVKTIAERYGDRAAGFEIWNEPNTPLFWEGSDDEFFELTRRTAALLKEILPDKPVAVGSIFYHPLMSGKQYLRKMIDHGVLENADALSLHPYGLSLTKSAERVADADMLLKKSGYDLDLWITEIGFTTSGWYPNQTSVQGQAEKVIQAITELSAAGADIICWFKLLDGQMPVDIVPGISSEEFFGLAYPDYSLKPSGFSFRLMATHLHETEFDNSPIVLRGLTPHSLKIYRYKGVENEIKLVCFSNVKEMKVHVSGFLGEVSVLNLLTGETNIIRGMEPFNTDKAPLLISGVLKSEDSVIEVQKID
ncbi:MAG: beta-galactosidase [Spirochaetales bacterium]|nr:beta-galactosidase [Spirochaetales bacterium]